MIVKRMEFTIDGAAQGKGRPRFNRYKKAAYTPKKTIAYENRVREAYINQCGGQHFEKGVPVIAIVTAGYEIPQSASKKRKQDMLDGKILPTVKPDGDNVLKAVLDALNGYAYYDDAQVVTQVCRKVYMEQPKVVVGLVQYENWVEKIYLTL